MLVPLVGNTKSQKSLFSYTFLQDSSLVFVLKELRQFKPKKPPSCFKLVSLNNVDNGLATR